MIYLLRLEKQVSILARRNIVFVIVEGASDETALGVILNKIYDKEKVYIHIVHGDITTQSGVHSQNIISKIGNIVRQYAKNNHFKQTDFQEIVHICDMDGAYILNDNIVENKSLNKTKYMLTHIETSNVKNIEIRNQRKRENLDRLCVCAKIWKLPYRIFYMSCNLDHVLYNALNITDDEKEELAYQFAKKYRIDIVAFLEYITHSDFAVQMDYKHSWQFIQQGLNSLQRYTNLSLCFDNIKIKEYGD